MPCSGSHPSSGQPFDRLEVLNSAITLGMRAIGTGRAAAMRFGAPLANRVSQSGVRVVPPIQQEQARCAGKLQLPVVQKFTLIKVHVRFLRPLPYCFINATWRCVTAPREVSVRNASRAAAAHPTDDEPAGRLSRSMREKFERCERNPLTDSSVRRRGPIAA